MESFLKEAKEASRQLSGLSGETKNRVLLKMADALEREAGRIMDKNAYDMKNGKEANLSSALMDRLLLNEKRIAGMAQAIREIAALKNPVGRILEGWVNDNGLRIEKVAVPIGVIGIIYESRPNVTSDTAALCFKSGNVCVLKGGKEAQESNVIIAEVLQEVLESEGLPKAMISLLPDSSREGVSRLIKMDRYVDLIIPRGGEGLIRFVNENASVPVVKHDKGLCHIYVDEAADLNKAIPIIINAKTQRPGVCNALETLLVDKAIASQLLPDLAAEFAKHETELRGCAITRRIIEANEATEEDWHTEYLDNILSIRIIEGLGEAVTHIAHYGSGHSDAILTENYATAQCFLQSVDSAAVYVNASTRFTDGGEFGFGAEVGISTNKLHARGPMGLSDLCTYKYCILGSGQIR